MLLLAEKCCVYVVFLGGLFIASWVCVLKGGECCLSVRNKLYERLRHLCVMVGMSFIVRVVRYICVCGVDFGLCTYSTKSIDTCLTLYCCDWCSCFKFQHTISLSLSLSLSLSPHIMLQQWLILF